MRLPRRTVDPPGYADDSYTATLQSQQADRIAVAGAALAAALLGTPNADTAATKQSREPGEPVAA